MAKDNTRKSTINKMLLMAIICIILGSVCLVYYFKETRVTVVNFKENSNADYKVYLKENEFYDKNYLEEDNQYIAELIDKIDTKFNYNMNISNRYTYNYTYKLIAEVEVKDLVNNNTIYEFKENLIESEEKSNTGELVINENVEINYPKYNELISKFKNTYELNNSKSNLNIVLYLNINRLNNNKNLINNKKVSSITIPLTENTISIDRNNNEQVYTFNIIGNKDDYIYWVSAAAVLFLFIGLIYIIMVIIYAKRTRTAEMIYEKELKNITSNYDSYIQRISENYDIGTSQVIKIESFNDMLEIRDTLKQPILMLENETKTGTFFIIPATNNIIYTYALRVVDIEAKMKGNDIPSYDIKEIPREKKYTKEYIDEEITRTSKMPSIDSKNVIKGNKDKENDLYEQLELTRSFSIDEIKKAVRKAKKRKDERLKEKEETKRQLQKRKQQLRRQQSVKKTKNKK